MQSVSIVKVKTHISELVIKSAYNNERYIITKRNKPVAALVSIEDLKILEQHEEKSGLIEIIHQWKDFEEIAEALTPVSKLRASGGKARNVSL